MTISTDPEVTAGPVAPVDHESSRSERAADHQLTRWGGAAGLAGAVLMIGAVAVVVGLGLPDASDPETLTDFGDIKTGRIFEHFFYLGALMLFALHALVLHRLLRAAHAPAALFGAVVAMFGFVMMAASSMLHVATSPLADLYTAPGTPDDDLRSIEYAWHGMQSVFDTMLATGVLLVPIGILLFGVAMRNAPAFGRRLTWAAIVLGVVGVLGAAIEIIEPDLEFSGASVLAIVVFHVATGWRTWKLGNDVVPRHGRER